MKKNLILYVLLGFLIIVNGFFIFNFMGEKEKSSPRGPRRNIEFIAKQLDFNEAQLKQLRQKSKQHHQRMFQISEEVRNLKDELFDKVSDESVSMATIDSITSLIGEKEKQKDMQTFRYFKTIRELCDDQQKEKFQSILKDAMHKRGMQRRFPPQGEAQRMRPPPRNP